jgi:hypothetical protein
MEARKVPSRRTLVAALCLAVGFLPASAHAFSATNVAPGYSAAPFTTLPLATNSLGFATNGDAYVAPNPPGSTVLVEFAQAPSYAMLVASASYPNNGSMGPSSSVTGLDFSSTPKLYASETIASGNAGYIREVATGTEIVTLSTFRPTGIAVANDNTFYFTGRQSSNGSFGGVYRANRNGSAVLVIPDIIGRGIARNNASGDIFVSTPPSPVSAGYLASSIYKFPGGSLPAQFVATFDGSGPAELAQDTSGKVYALGDPVASSTPVIVLAQAPSAPAVPAWSNLALGSLLAATGIVIVRRRRAMLS